MLRPSIPLCVLLAACGGRAAAPAPSPAPASGARAAPATEPATLRYAAGAARYRVESALHSVQEVMGATQEANVTTTMIVSTMLTEEAGQLVLAATLDSITLSGTAPGLDAGALNSARGRTIRARFTPQGRPIAVTGQDSTDAVANQLARSIREFLAALPQGPVTVGTTWSDTLSEDSPMPGGTGHLTTRSIRQNRVVGWEMKDGVRALRLAMTGTFTINGSGDMQGAALEMSGGGTASADKWVTSSGVYQGATANDSTNLTVIVISAGVTVPVRQVQRTTVTRIP